MTSSMTTTEESLHEAKQAKRKQKKSNMMRLRNDRFSSSTSVDELEEGVIVEDQLPLQLMKNPGQGRRRANKEERKQAIEVPLSMQESWIQEFKRHEARDNTQTTALSADAPAFVPNAITEAPVNTRSKSRKGSRKSKKESRKKSHFSPEEPTNEMNNLEDMDDGDETCLVCAKTVKFLAVGKCGHPICSLCALRLRLKSKDKEW